MAFTNSEIVIYAIHLLGGGTRVLHTEDITLKCFELAPDCFSWVKHSQYPDKEIARVALKDARKGKTGPLVVGRSGRGMGHATGLGKRRAPDGWQLSEAGIEWVKANEDRLADGLGQRQPKMHRQELLHKLARVQNHPLFKDFLHEPSSFAPSLGALADLLRCRVDADPGVWDKRLNTLRKQALVGKQKDIADFLDACRTFVQSGSGKEEL